MAATEQETEQETEQDSQKQDSTSNILLTLNQANQDHANNLDDVNSQNIYSPSNISETQQSTSAAQTQTPDPTDQFSSQLSQYQQTFDKIFKDATSPNGDPAQSSQQANDLNGQLTQFISQNQEALSQQKTDSQENNLDQFGNSTQPNFQDLFKNLLDKTTPSGFQSLLQSQPQQDTSPTPSPEQSSFLPSFKPGGLS